MSDENMQSRRSLLTALFATAVVAPVAALMFSSDDAQAQERQFTGVRHEPRAPRRSSGRRHRRVARVHHRGRPRPLKPETKEQ
jgi:hypothetical protein